MKIDATIQARMGSTRLPGKVLIPIAGKPMLALQIERIRESRLIDRVIVATSTNPADDRIETLARDLGVECFRGSEDDVIGRVTAAVGAFGVETHVEFQGDNPLPDALLVDSIIGFYLKNADRYDYVTNALKTTYPPGAEVSVYSAAVLREAERHADPEIREHVGPHIYQHPERFRIHNLEAPPWLHGPDIHLEVDTEEDLALVTAVVEHFRARGPGFGLQQIIELVREKNLGAVNQHVERRWRAFRKDARE